MCIGIHAEKLGESMPSKKAQHAYYQKNRESIIAKQQARYAADPDGYKRYMRMKYVERTYGMTMEEHDRLKSLGCSICHVTHGKMCVDHDHVSQEVRGILCNSCNIGLGMFRDDEALLRSAIEYLQCTGSNKPSKDGK